MAVTRYALDYGDGGYVPGGESAEITESDFGLYVSYDDFKKVLDALENIERTVDTAIKDIESVLSGYTYDEIKRKLESE